MTTPNTPRQEPDELVRAAAVAAEAAADPAVRADVVWLADTIRRMQLRLGRTLVALGELPALFAAASRLQTPEMAYDDAEAITAVIRRASVELVGIEDYAWAVTDPGEASCRTCGTRLAWPAGQDGPRHWRLVADPAAPGGHRQELFDAGHEPEPVWARPVRPVWTDRTAERALDAPDHRDAQSPADDEGSQQT